MVRRGKSLWKSSSHSFVSIFVSTLSAAHDSRKYSIAFEICKIPRMHTGPRTSTNPTGTVKTGRKKAYRVPIKEARKFDTGFPNPNILLPNRLDRPSVRGKRVGKSLEKRVGKRVGKGGKRVEWTLVAEGIKTEMLTTLEKRMEWNLLRMAEGIKTEMLTTEHLTRHLDQLLNHHFNRIVSTLQIAILSRLLGTLLFALCMLLKDVIYIFSVLTFSFRCGG